MTIGATVLLVTVLAMPVFARGPGWGGGPGGRGQGYGPGNCPNTGAWDQNLTEEQRTQIDALHKKFFDNTATARGQIWAKQGELQALLSSANPDAGKAKALQKDLSDLRAQMSQERLTLQLEERKINPDARFGYWGRQGKGGAGPGMRYGRGLGGYGQGGRWN
jgi:Spy/CpxP family protein refolding chaperone